MREHNVVQTAWLPSVPAAVLRPTDEEPRLRSQLCLVSELAASLLQMSPPLNSVARKMFLDLSDSRPKRRYAANRKCPRICIDLGT